MKPSRLQTLLFWLLVAATSTFFAEVISGSSPRVFFDGWGLIVVTPLYGLHTLVLGALAFRNGPPRFRTLFFAGMLFGLYEAYITKVLWLPPWGASINVLGVDLLAFSTLVPYWHAFMAFIVPLLVIEQIATPTQPIFANFPARGQRWLNSRRFLFGLAIWFGMIQTAGQPVGQSFVSGLTNLAVVAALYWFWKRSSQRRFELTDLLPKRGGFALLAALLALLYLWATFSILPERLPAFGDQLTIWVLYALIGFAFWRSLRKPGVAPKAASPFDTRLAWKLLGAYLASTLLFSFLSADFKTLLFVINILGGTLFGLVVLVSCLRRGASAK